MLKKGPFIGENEHKKKKYHTKEKQNYEGFFDGWVSWLEQQGRKKIESLLISS